MKKPQRVPSFGGATQSEEGAQSEHKSREIQQRNSSTEMIWLCQWTSLTKLMNRGKRKPARWMESIKDLMQMKAYKRVILVC